MNRLSVLSSHLGGVEPTMVAPTSSVADEQEKAINKIQALAAEHGLDIAGGTVRRTSSRCCLAVEHGDYNGTELFGVGTDRFIWLAYKARSDNKVRIVSGNFVKDGVVQWSLGDVPKPGMFKKKATKNYHSNKTTTLKIK